jgi:hypothetical protein
MIHSQVYIERFGFRDIVRISTDWREETKGFQNEHTTEVVACKIQDKYFKVSIYCFSQTMKGDSFEIKEKLEIEKEEYDDLYKKHNGIIDTDESREAISELNRIKKDMDNIYPLCPSCSSKMTKREGPRGVFLGCNCFPRCRGTREYKQSYAEKSKELQAKMDIVSKRIIP